MAALIASQTAAATSADQVLADGANATVNLMNPQGTPSMPNGCSASIQIKDSAGSYLEIGVINERSPVLLVSGPCTFRVVKKAGDNAFGVDKT